MKVGEYVRYKRPFDRKETIMIGKILSIYEPNKQSEIKGYDLDTRDVISDEFSIKSSPNIIDLIEYGDIIKYKIDDEEFISEVWGEKNDYFVQEFDIPEDLRNLNIVSIVTHEQFSQMEYRIGG